MFFVFSSSESRYQMGIVSRRHSIHARRFHIDSSIIIQFWILVKYLISFHFVWFVFVMFAKNKYRIDCDVCICGSLRAVAVSNAASRCDIRCIRQCCRQRSSWFAIRNQLFVIVVDLVLIVDLVYRRSIIDSTKRQRRKWRTELVDRR